MTRKITRALASILAGKQERLYLGNLEAKRDWGYAPEYEEAMWLMVQQEEPEDYVIATGEAHSVKEFLEEAFSYADLDWRKYVEIDPRYFRPIDIQVLVADSSRAQKKLGWEPKITFKRLVRILVDSDLEVQGIEPIGEGKRILTESFEVWHQQVKTTPRGFYGLLER